jgi:hypothetical protein
MRTLRPRPHSLNLPGLLILGAIAAASACANTDDASWIDDPALRGATVGEVEAMVADHEDGTSERHYFFNVAGAGGARGLRLVFPGGQEPTLASGDRVGVWGDLLGDEFRVSRHVVMPAPAETSIVSALIGAPAKPRTAVFVIVDVGGGAGTVTAASATTTVFSPGNNFASVYDKLSFGIQKMSGDVQGPFSYPMTTCDYSGLRNAVKPMVQGTYQHYMWFFATKVSACAWSGIGSEGNTGRPQSDSWYNASTGCTVLVQEVGHNMGWMHSSTLACSGQTFVDDPTSCTSSEYGNRMTPMGSGCGMLNGHDLWYGQFIGGCNGVKVTSSGTFNLFALETACNGIQTIQIPMVKTGRMAKPTQGSNQPLKNYYIEYRTKTGLDANLTSAVYVYAGDDIRPTTRSSNWSWLLDMNPSTSTFDGLQAGGSFTDPTGEIKITVMSADTTKAVVQIDVTGGAGAAPACMDGTTTTAPGPVDCGSGPVTGVGGMGGGGGAGGAGGSGGSAGTGGRGGNGGTTSGRGGAGGATGAGGTAGGATSGRGGTTGGSGGSAAGSSGTAGRGGAGGGVGGSGGAIGVAGGAGTIGPGGTTGGSAPGGTTGGSAGGSIGGSSVAGSTGMMGKAGATGIDGGVTGGCECALDPSSPKGTWSATWLSMFASVLIVRRRPHRRRR